MTLLLFCFLFEYHENDILIKNGYVYYKGLDNYGEIGAPALPFYTKHFPVPIGQKVTMIDFIIKDSVIIDTEFKPERVAPPKGWLTLPDAESLPSVYPLEPVTFHFSTFRGLGLLTINIMPVRYDNGQLILYKSIKVKPHYSYGSIRPLQTMGKYSFELTKSIFKYFTNINPTLPPPSVGFDLLVISPDRMLPVADRYAKLKRLTGLNTLVVRYEDILGEYPNTDAAASLRDGIKNLYKKNGFIFLTLIGDSDILPVRKFFWTFSTCLFGREIPTDHYYAFLDGDWNFDKDYNFGEIEDSVDLFPDIFVGRIPVSDTTEGFNYLEKLERMHTESDSSINDRIIFFASNIFQPGDGRTVAESIINHIPDTLNPYVAILDQQQGNLFKTAAFDSLRSGFRVIFGLGHGNPTRFQYGIDFAEFPDFDILNNYYKAGLIYHITCSNSSFETNCVGEHLVNNRDGGCISFVGPAWVSFLFPHCDFAEYFVELLPNYPVGVSALLSIVPFIPQINSDEIIRLIAFEINTLGDPTLIFPLKKHVPINQFSHKDTVNTGLSAINVSYLPKEGGYISFLGGGCHKTAFSTGNSQLEIYPDSQGDGLISLARPGECIIIDTVKIIEPDYHLTVTDLIYQPGKPNPFEEGSLCVLVKNCGILLSPPAQLNISSDNQEVEVVSNQAYLSGLAPGDSAWSTPPFIIRLKDLKENEAVRFSVVISAPLPCFFDTFELLIAEPSVQRIKNILIDENNNGKIEPSESFSLEMLFANRGSEKSDTMTCLLTADPTYVNLTIDSIDLMPINPGSTLILGSFAGQATEQWYPDVQFILSIDTTIEYFELDPPNPPVPIYAVPGDSGIIIEWEWQSGNDVCGFFVFRDDPEEALRQLNSFPISMGRYTDTLKPSYNCINHYYITSVDTSANESRLSTSITANKIPIHRGFPVSLSYYNYSSPRLADIDRDYPGLEIIMCCRDGNLFRYYEDGSGGIIASLGNQIWGTPAIGDVDCDGELEIVVGTRVNPGEIWVLDKDGNAEPGFPITVDGSVLSSIAISNLDDDDQLEMTLVTTTGVFYIIDHDGSTIFSRDIGDYHWGTPAIGDVDNDGELEIIPPTGIDTVYIFEKDGSIMHPFPVNIPGIFFYGPTIADLDGDDFLEIALGLSESGGDKILILEEDGSIMGGWPLILDQKNVDDHVSFADLDFDGLPEIAVDYMIETWTGGVAVIDQDGSYLRGWPKLRGEGSSNAIICDINNDQKPEVIVGSADRKLYGFRYSGKYCEGFPIQLGHTIYTTPAVADIDQDGQIELAVAAENWKLYLFDLLGKDYPGALIWPCFRADLMNTGCYQEPEVSVSSSEVLFNRLLGVIPVPARSPLLLSYNVDSEMEIRVFDVMGRVIRKAKLKGKGSYRIDLPAGVYFLNADFGARKFSQKIVLLR